MVIDSLIRWSLEHPDIVGFSSAAAKEQHSLGFHKRADGNLLWEAYPGGRSSESKLCFFTRSWTYLSAAADHELRERFVVDLKVTSAGKPKAVIGLPVKGLRDEERRAKLFAYFEWTLQQPRFSAAK